MKSECTIENLRYLYIPHFHVHDNGLLGELVGNNVLWLLSLPRVILNDQVKEHQLVCKDTVELYIYRVLQNLCNTKRIPILGYILSTVEPLNNGHFGTSYFVLY